MYVVGGLHLAYSQVTLWTPWGVVVSSSGPALWSHRCRSTGVGRVGGVTTHSTKRSLFRMLSSLRLLKAAFHRGSHFACGGGAGHEFQGRFFCGSVVARCAIENLPVAVVGVFSSGRSSPQSTELRWVCFFLTGSGRDPIARSWVYNVTYVAISVELAERATGIVYADGMANFGEQILREVTRMRLMQCLRKSGLSFDGSVGFSSWTNSDIPFLWASKLFSLPCSLHSLPHRFHWGTCKTLNNGSIRR